MTEIFQLLLEMSEGFKLSFFCLDRYTCGYCKRYGFCFKASNCPCVPLTGVPEVIVRDMVFILRLQIVLVLLTGVPEVSVRDVLFILRLQIVLLFL